MAAEPKGFDRETYARQAGFSSWAERQKAIEAQKQAYRLAEAWRKSQPVTPPRPVWPEKPGD